MGTDFDKWLQRGREKAKELREFNERNRLFSAAFAEARASAAWPGADPKEIALSWRERNDLLREAFPDSEQQLTHDELRALARGLEKNRKLLAQVSLVQYRCGAMRPNGKPRGCLLGAVLQTQGQRLWVHRQAVEVETIDSARIEAYLHGGAPGFGDVTEQIVMESMGPDGDLGDWEPETLSEFLSTDPATVVGADGLALTVRPAWHVRVGGYRVLGMNCRHVEHHPSAEQLIADMKRVRGARNKTVYITP